METPIDPDTAYRFILGVSKKPVSRRPRVLADAVQREDGWYYRFQGFPCGVHEEGEETLDGGPFASRSLALEELRNDVSDWFFDLGLDTKHIREDSRFLTHLSDDNAVYDEGYDDDDDD